MNFIQKKNTYKILNDIHITLWENYNKLVIIRYINTPIKMIHNDELIHCCDVE